MIYKNKEGEFITVKFSKRKGKFVIPNKIMDYELYIIESRDFIHWDELTEIIIPTGVLIIGVSAFEYCPNLTNVKIPNSVITVGEFAFWECNNLNIVIDNSNDKVGIGYGAFSNCKSVTWLKD